MDRLIYNVSSFLVCLLSLGVFLSCQNDMADTVERGDGQSYRLIWEGDIQGYAESRGPVREKKDGDCVYLLFNTAGGTVKGTAIYNSSLDEWTVNCNGDIPVGTTSSCIAYYIDKVVEGEPQTIELDQRTLVCSDTDAEYTKGNGYIRLTATLTPSMGRIRFKGTEGQSFLLSGIKYLTGFNTWDVEPVFSQAPLQLTVGSDGYTEPVHALPQEDRTLMVYYDYQTYRTPCTSPILDAGHAGYMLLPTEEAHSGWSLVKVDLAGLTTVATNIISDVFAEVSAEVTSLGNCTLLDAGFVYAETSNPTLVNSKGSCGEVRSLSAILCDLKPSTEYYVRAYATNERGTAYGEELKFMTTSIPTVPNVRTGQVTSIQHNRADVAGTIVNLGETNSVIQHGHVWSTKPNPTIKDSKTELGALSATGDYTSTMTGLQPNTTYYVRAYAANDVWTSYGEQQTFTTSYGNVALTLSATSVKYNRATINTVITDTGGYTISERGICWSKDGTPYLSDNCAVATGDANTYSLTMTALTEETTYYVRAYVRTENDQLYYSEELAVTTPCNDDDFTLDGFDEDENWNL